MFTQIESDLGTIAEIPSEVFERSKQRFIQAAGAEWRRIQKPFHDALTEQPRPSFHPFTWSYDPVKHLKAMRWYFAAIARGDIETDGIRYIRQNAMRFKFDEASQDDWYIGTVYTDQLDDTKRYKYRYTVGTFNPDNGTKWQIPGHRNTGWHLIAEVADTYMQAWFAATIETYTRLEQAQ